MSPPARLLAAAVVLALGIGCAKTAPGTAPVAPPEKPPLDARSLTTGVRLPEPPVPLPVSALAADAQADTSRPAPRPDAPVRPSPPLPDPPERPPGRLATPETADAEATTARINATLDRARKALATVRPERLSADARVQYQTAQQLIEQAADAVKARNFVYAIRLADKAETLARRLAGGI